MSNAYTPILVGVTFPVLEILLLSKTAKWSSKNLIDWNRLKKFMQVGVDVTCMCTDFGGRDLFSFGDIATFKNGQTCSLSLSLSGESVKHDL